MIDHRIAVPDHVEVVRDALADLIARELANQCRLAAEAHEEPLVGPVRVYAEHLSPWEQFRDVGQHGATGRDDLPIVNVVYMSSTFDQANGSSFVGQQRAEATFQVECYAYAPSVDRPDGGHIPADKGAALRVHAVSGLVRKILMAGPSADLGLEPGTISRRWVPSVRIVRPPNDVMHAQQIGAAIITYVCEFEEAAPLQTPRALESIGGKLLRSPDGEVLVEMHLTHPQPSTT